MGLSHLTLSGAEPFEPGADTGTRDVNSESMFIPVVLEPTSTVGARATFAARDATQRKGMGDVANGRAPEQHRFLEYHGLTQPYSFVRRCPGPQNNASGGGDQAMHEPQQ